MSNSLPGFSAKFSVRSNVSYGGMATAADVGDDAVYPAQSCEWWRMSICGPHIWDCGWWCAPARAVSKKTCLDCMTGCIAIHVWWMTSSFCTPCASSFC